MEKPINTICNPKTTLISKDLTSESISLLDAFLKTTGVSEPPIPQYLETKDSYSVLIHSLLKLNTVQRGRISYLLSVKPAFLNIFGGMHGGAVGAVSEVVSIACARTVVGEDKELFLGEHSISYLSAAPANAEVIVDGSVVRSGRNVTVIAIDFRLKESGRLAYTSSATFYNMGVASL